jgi:processing peptidase subunit beta
MNRQLPKKPQFSNISKAHAKTSKAHTKASKTHTKTPKTPLTSTKRNFSNQTAIDRCQRYPVTQLDTTSTGLRVATEHTLGDLVSVSVAVEAGSRYEAAENNGTAHFLEHTFFKGTNKRNRTQLEMEVENLGGTLNAFTTREQTVFTATFQKRNLANALDILSDMAQNSRVTEKAVENERHVILEEYNSIQQTLQEVVYDNFHRTAFQGSSLAFDILGPVDNIRKITKDDIDRYVKIHYTTPRMLVAGVGDIDHGDFKQLVSKYFNKLPTATPAGLPGPNPGKAKWTSDMTHVDDSELYQRDQSGMAIAFPTAGFNDSDHFTLMAIQMGLQDIGDDLGGSVEAFNTQYSDHSLFGLYLEAEGEYMGEHVKSSLEGLVLRLGKAKENLEFSKNSLKSTLLAQYEGAESINHEVCRQILSHGRRMHPLEVIARIDAVDEASVDRVLKNWFDFSQMAATVVGPTGALPTLDELKAIQTAKF